MTNQELDTQTRDPLPPPSKNTTYEYACSKCGSQWWAARKNAHKCLVCRLIDDMTFIANKTKKCWRCNKEFLPINRNDVACAEHQSWKGVPDIGPCLVCKEPDSLPIHSDVKICGVCLRDPDPRKRARLLNVLEHRQKLDTANPRPTGYPKFGHDIEAPLDADEVPTI